MESGKAKAHEAGAPGGGQNTWSRVRALFQMCWDDQAELCTSPGRSG